MADWNAYEARIRDRALVDAAAALAEAGWHPHHPSGAVSVVLSLRTRPGQLPIPPKATLPMQYPFDDMAVGDHFDRPRDRGMVNGSDRRQKSIMAAAKAWRKRRGSDAQFTTRLIDDNTVRCWRTA